MRSPWNGGLMRRRSRWWRSPSRSRIECAPRIGPRMGATASPERRSSPSAVKMSLIPSGSVKTTIFPRSPIELTVKRSHHRRGPIRAVAWGQSATRRACQSRRLRGRGGHGRGHHRLVQLLEQRREDDLAVTPVGRVDERVLAVVVDARLAEAGEALERRPGLGEDPPRRLKPARQALAHDGAEDLLLVLEVAVEGARGDAGVTGQ